MDACPNVPEDEDGFEDVDGCPEPDNDGDGVGDRFDGAPNLPETLNGWADSDGVPDEIPPILARFLGEQPRVAFNGESLADVGEERLDLLAAILGTFPEVHLHVTVPDASPERAQARAESVRARLLADSVAAERVTVEGVEGAGAVRVALGP